MNLKAFFSNLLDKPNQLRNITSETNFESLKLNVKFRTLVRSI